jgi:hypothetical protein
VLIQGLDLEVVVLVEFREGVADRTVQKYLGRVVSPFVWIFDRAVEPIVCPDGDFGRRHCPAIVPHSLDNRYYSIVLCLQSKVIHLETLLDRPVHLPRAALPLLPLLDRARYGQQLHFLFVGLCPESHSLGLEQLDLVSENA